MQVSRPIISVVTDRRRLGGTAPLVAFAARAARAGATIIQIRERGLSDRELLSLARRIVAHAQGTAAAIVVNDRADVAAASGAGGVHLRGDSPPASRVRAAAPPAFLIGRSIHSLDEAIAAEDDGGADYLVFGTVYESASKPGGTAAGLRALEQVCRRVRLPVLAIGGVTLERAADLAAAGAAGVAAIGMFVDADRHAGSSPGLAPLVERLRRAFDTRSQVV